jgi:hypothetical protein
MYLLKMFFIKNQMELFRILANVVEIENNQEFMKDFGIYYKNIRNFKIVL